MAGQSTGTQCIFPFTYRGVIHKACTKHGIEDTEYEPWCATKVDDFGNNIPGNWGDCGSACPFEPGNINRFPCLIFQSWQCLKCSYCIFRTQRK